MACLYCNSTQIDYKCKDCGESFCFKHTGSTDKYYCRKHPTPRMNRLEAEIRGNRCQILERSRCPLCGNVLEIKKLTSGQFYLQCTKCTWNSRVNTPRIIATSERAIEREADKYGLSRKGTLCREKLRKDKGKEFCLNCFYQEVTSNTETFFINLQNKFGLNVQEIEAQLREMLETERIRGFLDPKKRVFIFLDEQTEENLIANLQSTGYIDMNALQSQLGVSPPTATQIIIFMIRKKKLRGTFTNDKKKYYLEGGLTQAIIQEIKEKGRVVHRELAKKFQIQEGNIKNYVMNIIRNKLVSAYFVDNGNSTVTIEELENEIENYCMKNGQFLIVSLAKHLKVAPELARRTLFSLIQKGVVRGIFTQNHEFLMEDEMSEKIKTMARAYRQIPLKELARKLAITETRVEEGLATLIARGSIAGYIDMAKHLFIADDKQPVTKFGSFAKEGQEASAPSSAGSPMPTQTGEIEVVRQYDFVGGQLHFKVVVRNKTNMAVHDIKVILDVPSSYRRSRDLITISVIDPGNTHGVDFYLEPAECGISTIGGTVLYKDAMGRTNSIFIQPKDVQIKCPLVIKTLDTIEDCQKAIQSLPSDARAFLIADLPPQMAYSAAHRAISQFDTRNVASYEDDGTGPYEAEAWFSSEAKVTGGRIITRAYLNGANSTLEIRVWCNEAGQLTGFLAKIIEILFVEINLMRRIKAEERSKTLDVMAITRNIMEVQDMCMLRYKASSAKLKLEDTHARLTRVAPDNEDVSQKIYDWIKKLEDYDDEAMLQDEDADRLEKDIENIHQVLQVSMGA